MTRHPCATCTEPVDDAASIQRIDPTTGETRWLHHGDCARADLEEET